MKLGYTIIAALPLLALGCGSEENGSITGTVTAASGAAVVGATVATDPATSTATTDAAGKYTIADVEKGTYTVTVTASGYVTKQRTGVAVSSGAAAKLDVLLDPATGSIALTLNDLCDHSTGFTVSRTGAADVTSNADGSGTIDGLTAGDHTFTITGAGYLAQTKTVTVTAGQSVDLAADMKCQSLAVAEAARTYLAKFATTPATAAVATTAQVLYDNLNDGVSTNDPVVLSVRTSADYALGHIPGALDVSWKTVADDTALTLLGTPDASKKYVDYCYTGHTGGIAAAVLNMLGYATTNMKYGFTAWTTDATARTASGTPPDYSKSFGTVTAASTVTTTHDLPWLALDGVTTEREAVIMAARSYLKDATIVATITAQALFDNLNDGNAANDPFIISTQAATDYAAGHIPGAINVPLKDIAKAENLALYPTDRQIVVACYTGHTAAIAAGVLGTLGYHKVANLKWGLAGWNSTSAGMGATALWSDATDAKSFAFNTGATP